MSVLGEFSGSVEDLELLGATELVAGGTSFPLAHIASTDRTVQVSHDHRAGVVGYGTDEVDFTVSSHGSLGTSGEDDSGKQTFKRKLVHNVIQIVRKV